MRILGGFVVSMEFPLGEALTSLLVHLVGVNLRNNKFAI